MVEHQHQQIEAHPHAPDPQPPELTHDAHEPEHQQDQRAADGQAEQGLLGHIGEEVAWRLAIETEAGLDAELVIQAQGQFHQGAGQE